MVVSGRLWSALEVAVPTVVRLIVQPTGSLMPRSRPSQDIQPLSEFRANVARFVEQVQNTKRPMVLTQHGRSAAILMAVEAYEDLLEQVELIRDVYVAESEVAAGKGLSHGKALAHLRSGLARHARARGQVAALPKRGPNRR